MQYLASQGEGVAVGGAILVAGFAEPVAAFPELDRFTRQPMDYGRLKRSAGQWVTLRSLNDDVVPPDLTQTLSRSLSAELFSFSRSICIKQKSARCSLQV